MRSRVMLLLGPLLLIAAVVGFVVLPEHAPSYVGGMSLGNGIYTAGTLTGLAQTTYDALRVATWAFVIVGTTVLAVGLLDYSRRR